MFNISIDIKDVKEHKKFMKKANSLGWAIYLKVSLKFVLFLTPIIATIIASIFIAKYLIDKI